MKLATCPGGGGDRGSSKIFGDVGKDITALDKTVYLKVDTGKWENNSIILFRCRAYIDESHQSKMCRGSSVICAHSWAMQTDDPVEGMMWLVQRLYEDKF